MTAPKPKVDRAKLKPTSGRERMTIDYPVDVLRQPDAVDGQAADKRDRTLALLGITDARLAGKDVTPGHDELHHYWTRGEGLAKWKFSPKPWTTLLALLVEHVKPPKPLATLKKWTSAWFIEVFGYAAGSDKNRVAHGKPPRGHKIGPG